MKCLSLFAIVFWVFAAIAADPVKNPAPDGVALYKTNCLTCHGEKGDGMGPAGQYLNPKPRNFKDDSFKNGDSIEGIAKTLTDGIPNTPMVGFKALSLDEKKALAAYVRSLRGKK